MSSKRVIRTCQRGIHAALLLALLALASHSPAQRDPLVQGVDAIGITVSDMDRAMEFYSKVLTFEKISDTEVAGEIPAFFSSRFALRASLSAFSASVNGPSFTIFASIEPSGIL